MRMTSKLRSSTIALKKDGYPIINYGHFYFNPVITELKARTRAYKIKTRTARTYYTIWLVRRSG